MPALVLSESAGPGIAMLTLNRPEKRNALSTALLQELLAALGVVEDDRTVRVLILCGAGPVFCSGLDLDEAADAGGAGPLAELIAQVLRRLAESRLVSIAVVHGVAIAGGAGLLSACDFAFAEETTRIGYPEIHRGLVAALVMTFLRRQLRERDARELLLTGELILANRAQEIGLINRTLPVGDRLTVPRAVAAAVLKGGPEAVAATKRLLANLWPSSLPSDLAQAIAVHLAGRQSAETKEGLAAFREKRPPDWSTY